MGRNSILSFLNLDYPKTRIMATIGESNYSYEHLADMVRAGASMFRLNGAHIRNGEFDFKPGLTVRSVLDNILCLSEERRQPIVTFLDLAGPKVRVQRLMSLDRRWKDHRSETDMPNHPRLGDTVYVYAKEVAWDSDPIRTTLGKMDPVITLVFAGLTDPKRVSEFASRLDTASLDDVWRIQTDIVSFDTVDDEISLKDGKCTLTIVRKESKFVECRVKEVAEDFLFLPYQGVNPKGYIFPEVLTEEDIKDCYWALESGIDAISMSFACSPFDAFYLKKLIQDAICTRKLARRAPLVFAKFETLFSVSPSNAQRFVATKQLQDKNVYRENIAAHDLDRYLRLLHLYESRPTEAICEAFDGAMVARGDLAVEANKYLVPFYQKTIIEACRLRQKPVIVATEVLQSMQAGNPSTRAEVGDIATAVIQEADMIMLSGEVASTKSKPAKVVAELRQTITAAEEKCLGGDKEKDFQRLLKEFEDQLYVAS